MLDYSDSVVLVLLDKRILVKVLIYDYFSLWDLSFSESAVGL